MSGGSLNSIQMSPRKRATESSEAVTLGLNRLWIGFGTQVRDFRRARGWSVDDLARRANLSPTSVYLIEAGRTGSARAAARIATALGRRAELNLVDPRRQTDSRSSLSADPVHSAMGEFEARHFRAQRVKVGLDEPYQHYQFAGRADLVAWDLDRAALLHVENRTRFPDFQEMAGSYNAKRAYLGTSMAARLGLRNWASETHVIAALWSAEVLHALRLRSESFRSICPDPPDAFMAWWSGRPPPQGSSSCLVVLDPFARDRQRVCLSLEGALSARPRHRGYAEVARRLLGSG